MELLERRQLLSGTVVGFEDSADLSNFAYTRVLSAGQSNAPLSQADGHDGHILQLGYTHHHDGVKFSPSGEDYLLSNGTISVDARLRYYGPTGGTANGTIPALILKQPSPAANDAYMVTLDQTGGTLRMIIGAAKEIGGSREAYKYYGPSNGHSAYASIILSGYTPVLNNASHDLGWYTIAASISGGEEGSPVTITAKVTAPEGTSYYGQWSDTGPSAWTGTGTVGIAQYSQWSQAGEFDNFTVDEEVTLFTPPVVSIEAEASTVVEGDTITYTVSRTGGDLNQALTVFLGTPSGTATSSSDYGTVPSSVTIAASQSSYSFGVTTIQDSAYEPDETLVVGVATNASYSFGASSAEAAIQDDDVELTTLTVNDGGDPAISISATDTGPDISLAVMGDSTGSLVDQFAGAGTIDISGVIAPSNAGSGQHVLWDVRSQNDNAVVASGTFNDDSTGIPLTADSSRSAYVVEAGFDGNGDGILDYIEVTHRINVYMVTAQDEFIFTAIAGETYTGAVQIYHNANPDAMTGEFAGPVNIDWGDGGSDTGIIQSIGNGYYAVIGSHIYLDGGNFEVHVTMGSSSSSSSSSKNDIVKPPANPGPLQQVTAIYHINNPTSTTQGHSAIIIPKAGGGCAFYTYDDSEKVTVVNFNNLDDAIAATKKVGYTRLQYWNCTPNQAIDAAEKALTYHEKPYNIRDNNCWSMVYGALRAAGKNVENSAKLAGIESPNDNFEHNKDRANGSQDPM